MDDSKLDGSNANPTCYDQIVLKITTWGPNDPPLQTSIPVLFVQICLAIGSNLFFLFLLRHHHQPRIVRNLLSALLMSPFVLEIFSASLSERIWPNNGNTNLRAFSSFGILYAMFIKGLQMDLSPLRNQQGGSRTLLLSFGIILIPFFIGCALYSHFSEEELSGVMGKAPYIYWGGVMASSSFPTLASILARLKLLSTDIGRESLCICMINDLVSWGVMLVVVSLSTLPHDQACDSKSWEPVITVFLFTLLFGVFCLLVIRPCIVYYLGKRYDDGELYEDSTVHFILILVICSGLVSEFFGGYAFVGAFSLGLAIPRGHFSQTVLEKIEECVAGVLMPLYFASVCAKFRGMSINLWLKHFNLALAATIIKPFCVFLFSVVCSMPIRDGFAIAVLNNAKGLLSMSIASVGFFRKHITREAYTVLVFIILLSTATVGPIMSLFYTKVLKNNRNYKRRTVCVLGPDDDFRVVACIQEPRNLPGILNLLEISNNSERSPMSVFGVHLMELIGRESAMLIVRQASGDEDAFPSGGNDHHSISKDGAQSSQIVSAFDEFRRNHIGGTVVQTLGVVSPMDSMHIDITNIAEDKQVSIILLHYHKHQGMDGKLEDGSNVEFRTVNHNLMRTAPCSVGLLINRSNDMFHITGGGSRRSGSEYSEAGGVVRLVMLYFGGPDDREALSYAWRLAHNQLVTFALIRFVPGDEPADALPKMSFAGEGEDEEDQVDEVEAVYTESEVEKIMDNDFIDRLLNRSGSREEKEIEYSEIRSNNGEETVAKLREMDHTRFDLYVVGRGDRVYSPMTAGLADWSENPELGAIGDVLVTSDFMADASVLVVQQHLNARKDNAPPTPLDYVR